MVFRIHAGVGKHRPRTFFAQEYLCRLLDWQREDDAIKLIVRCLHENAKWRSDEQSKDRVRDLLSRHAREDLIKQLGM